MRFDRLIPALGCAALLALGAGGCRSTAAPEVPRGAHVLPGPSVALPAAPLRQAAAEAPPSPDPPWYASRRDFVDTVTSGRRTATLERVFTRTFDRQRAVHGRVIDHYSTTIHRQSVTEGVR